MRLPKRNLWQTPKLRTDEDENRERKVSWLELFFDLVFVVVISQLSHTLSNHLSAAGVAAYLIFLVPAWWLWIGAIIYAERFESDDVSHRIATFLLMLPATGMALFIHAGLVEGAKGFTLSYIAGRTLLVVLWLRGGYHEPKARPMTRRFACGFSLSILLFALSLLVAHPTRLVLWSLALLIDVSTPLFTIRHQAILPRLSVSRLPERFGLFVLIVLGESVVGTVNGLASAHHVTLRQAFTAILCMALAFEIWWLYFDLVPRRQTKPGLHWSMARSYLHLPLVAGIGAMGAATLHLVAGTETVLTDAERSLIGAATACTLACLALIIGVLEIHDGEVAMIRRIRAMLLGASAQCLALTVLGGGLDALTFLGALVTLLVVPVALDAYH